MIDPRSPDFKPIIETEDNSPNERAPREWTPAQGLLKGMAGCLIVGALIGAGWSMLTCKRPDALLFYVHEEPKVMLVLATIGALFGFGAAWILFACMHRLSRMVGRPCVAGVVIAMLLIVTARQIVVAVTGVSIDELNVTGWQWLAPRRFFISNVGVWVGMLTAIYLFHEGESFIDLFPSST
ncbi:MAG: hypothetical protein GXP29_05920 [Planctomycetes bacterium]|nr:hypothetical protein [Planctomycetota bacterium]